MPKPASHSSLVQHVWFSSCVPLPHTNTRAAGQCTHVLPQPSASCSAGGTVPGWTHGLLQHPQFVTFFLLPLAALPQMSHPPGKRETQFFFLIKKISTCNLTLHIFSWLSWPANSEQAFLCHFCTLSTLPEMYALG